MKTIFNITFVLLLTFLSCIAKDNPKSGTLVKIKQLTEEGYFEWSHEIFMKASALCQRVLSMDENDPYANYYLSYSSYRLMNIAMTEGKKEEMQKYAGLAKGHAAALYEVDKFKSEAHTLMAAIIMMELALDHSQGMVLSQKIHGHLGKAEAADKSNPRVNLVRGVMMFNTPEQFGGGANSSIGILKTADAQFSKQPDSELMPTWGKVETKTWIGLAQQKLSKFEEAKETFESILEIKPDYDWIKHDLLPALEKKISQINNQG